jgi:DNA invertase Pin-like site-specific DNA recombinase
MPPVQVLYCRVSTEEQGDEGHSLEAQRARLELEAERRGWPSPIVIEDPGRSGTTLNRPGMQRALQMIASGEADTIAATKLDRLSRDLADWVMLLKRSEHEGWALVALDLGMDTTTPIGRACAHMMAVFAQLVRELISENTKEGLAVAREKGHRLGRPSGLTDEVRARILREWNADRSLGAIARGLNDDQVPTGQGAAAWEHNAVKAVLHSIQRHPLPAELLEPGQVLSRRMPKRRKRKRTRPDLTTIPEGAVWYCRQHPEAGTWPQVGRCPVCRELLNVKR